MNARYLLQDVATGEYFAAGGLWVMDCGSAHCFGHTYLALDRGMELKEKGSTQIIICTGTPQLSEFIGLADQAPAPCKSCPHCGKRAEPTH